MLGLGPVHIIILLLVVVLLFGTGRVSTLMGDVAKGIKSFKKGMAEDDEPAPRRISDERPVERPIPTPDVTPAPPAQHGSASEADRH
jgi:sec-independent protein translocase protein TatA